MSWESDVSASSSLISAAAKLAGGRNNSSALQQQAQYQEENIANNALRRAGTLQTSYLQSGIALDPNTAVNGIISQAFSQGIKDINRVQAIADAKSSNANTIARAAALSGIGDEFSKNKGLQNGFGDFFDQSAYGLNDAGFGNSAYDILDPSPT